MKPLIYRKQIELNLDNDKLTIKTDSGDHFIAFTRKTITDWASELPPGEFRSIQKEYLKMVLDGISHKSRTGTGEIKMFLCFRPGADYKSQSVDLAVLQVPDRDIWIVSTYQHTWFVDSKQTNLKLKTEDGDRYICFDAISEKPTQEHIFQFREQMRA